MLTVLTLLIRRKNPVNAADFTESITKQTGCVIKSVAFLFLYVYAIREIARQAFVLCELGVIAVLVNTISVT